MPKYEVFMSHDDNASHVKTFVPLYSIAGGLKRVFHDALIFFHFSFSIFTGQTIAFFAS